MSDLELLIKEKGRIILFIAFSLFMLSSVLYWYAYCDSKTFLLVFLLLTLALLILLACWNVFKKTKDGNGLFAIVLLASGLMFFALFTPGTVPDEPHHFWSSYALSDMISGKSVDYGSNSIEARSVDIKNDPSSYTSETFENIDRVVTGFNREQPDGQWDLITVPEGALDIFANPCYLKIFSALGILLAKCLNLGFYPLFYLGRLFNFLLFYVLVCIAVKVTPVFKTGFKAVALLPMTLHLAASYSYDAGIIGLALLTLSLYFKMIYADETISLKYMVATVICTALLAPCKVVYCVIAFVALLVPNDHFASARQARSFKLLAILSGLAAIAITRLGTLVQLSGVTSSSGLDHRGAETGSFYTVADAFTHPVQTILMVYRTFVELGDFYIWGAVGGSLGWFQADLQAPLYFVIAMLAILYFAFIRSSEEKTALAASTKLLFLCLAAVSWLGVMASMYLGWTFNTETTILGVQGRYLLPVMVLLFLGLRSNNVIYRGSQNKIVVLAMCSINLLYVTRLLSIALRS